MAYNPEEFLRIARTSGIEAARAYKARATVGRQPVTVARSAPPQTRKKQAAKKISEAFVAREQDFAQPLLEEGQLVPTAPPRADVSTGFLRPQPQPPGAVPPGVQRALTRNFLFASTPEPGEFAPNLARFVASGGGPFTPAPEGTLPPNLARFVASGGGPFRIGPKPPGLGRFLQSGGTMEELPPRIFERTQPEGALPMGVSRFVKSGGELPFISRAPSQPAPSTIGGAPDLGGGAAFPNAQNLFLAWRNQDYEARPVILFGEDFFAMPPELRDAMAGGEDMTLSEFMAAMGYVPIPGTDKWMRVSPTTIPGTGAGTGAGSFSTSVRNAARAGGALPAARGNRSSFGLTQWGITPGA